METLLGTKEERWQMLAFESIEIFAIGSFKMEEI